MTRALRNTLGLLFLLGPVAASAQDGSIVYRLGKDTVAVEKYSRTPVKFSGEMVARNGAAVQRIAYELTLAAGRITAATVKRMQADGTPVPNAPTEYRFAFRADSATRTTVFGDSSQVRTFAAANAVPSMPVFVYAPYALINELAQKSGRRDSVPALGLTGGVAYLGLEAMAGDTLRLRGGPYAMLLRYGQGGRLMLVDGSYTTNKAIGTPASGAADIASLAKTMKPTGVLSPRITAYAAFLRGPITVNYGSPAVRGRTVWGGTLVPFDTIWRTGANEAAHLATSKTIQLGDVTVAPGLYTIWIQHTKTGTSLIVNKQVGQWGTDYNAANDLGRVAMTMANTPDHVEDFTITVRALPQNRGAIDFAWGDRVATASFIVKP